MAVLAVAGATGGCSESPVTEVKEPNLQKGNRKRLDMLGEKSRAVAEKKR
jgi:hypothetical protein